MCVKYRNEVINDAVSNRLKEIFEYIAPKYNILLEEWNHDADHSQSYCLISTGGVTVDIIRQYIQTQGAKDRG